MFISQVARHRVNADLALTAGLSPLLSLRLTKFTQSWQSKEMAPVPLRTFRAKPHLRTEGSNDTRKDLPAGAVMPRTEILVMAVIGQYRTESPL